jgi:hypothetical protein
MLIRPLRLARGLAVALVAAPARADPPRAFSVVQAPAWARTLEPDFAAPPSTGASGGQEYLLLQRDTRVSESRVETFTHIAKRILSGPGLQAASQVSVEFDTYQSLVLHHVRIRRGEVTTSRLDTAAVKVGRGSDGGLRGRGPGRSQGRLRRGARSRRAQCHTTCAQPLAPALPIIVYPEPEFGPGAPPSPRQSCSTLPGARRDGR